MRIFIDESGDCGMRNRDSKRYFALVAVFFERIEMVERCDHCIAQLKKLPDMPEEFHFADNSPEQNRAFLSAVSESGMIYAGCILHKDRMKGKKWLDKSYFYERAISPVVGSLEDYIRLAPPNGKVIADDNDDPVYFDVLKSIFRKLKSASGRSLIEKVKPGRSRTSNMLQLADMLCGAAVQWHLYGTNEYRSLVEKREEKIHAVP